MGCQEHIKFLKASSCTESFFFIPPSSAACSQMRAAVGLCICNEITWKIHLGNVYYCGFGLKIKCCHLPWFCVIHREQKHCRLPWFLLKQINISMFTFNIFNEVICSFFINTTKIVKIKMHIICQLYGLKWACSTLVNILHNPFIPFEVVPIPTLKY